MNEKFFAFQNIEFLTYIVPCVLLLLAFYIWVGVRRRSALNKFAESGALAAINDNLKVGSCRFKIVLVLLALVILVVAIARPRWNPKPIIQQQRGRDVVFVLDVSRSMLAEDLRPNRLERSKLAILDCLEKIKGDRVGLVVFAGNAKVLCPLTLDYSFFRMALEDAGPESTERGGTAIADAVRKAWRGLLEDSVGENKDIIVITDGGDIDISEDKIDEKFLVEAAREAAEQNVRIITIGIGDEKTGKRIPYTTNDGRRAFVKYKGKEVWAKLNADVLRKLAAATPGGVYINVSTGNFDLGEIYQTLVASAQKNEFEGRKTVRYEEKFQIFLAIVFALLFIEPLISERKRGI